MVQASKWSDITREERFFTSFLFHDVQQNPKPLLKLLQSKLELSTSISIIDIGFEVCFFRDAFKANLISERQRGLEKVTFDLMLWLSNRSVVIIEAKAQQGFNINQLKMLLKSREIMLDLSTDKYPIAQIKLIGLCSSRYKPKDSTVKWFDALILWKEIAGDYPIHASKYNHADRIYGI